MAEAPRGHFNLPIRPTIRATNFTAVDDIAAMGGSVITGVEVVGITSNASRARITTTRGTEITAGSAIICAGINSYRLARTAGDARDPSILPFRGEYMHLIGSSKERVNGLIYPLPDPRYPFLGVHFTRTVHGEVLVGPNAVPALARSGYRWRDVAAKYLGELLRLPGVRKLAAQHWRRGSIEAWQSLTRRAYVKEIQAYVPSIESKDLARARAGVRAQAVGRNGDLISDFVVTHTGRVVALRNAPSPGATAALALAEDIVAQVAD